MPSAAPVEMIDITRAWKDEVYYESLSAEQKALLPVHPAGDFNLEYELKLLTRAPVLCIGTSTAECTCCIVHNTATCTTQHFTTSCTTTC